MMTHHFKFGSVAELVEASNQRPASAENSHHAYLQENVFEGSGLHWVCADRKIATHKDVHRYLNGQVHPKGVQRIESMASKLCAPTPVNRRRKPVRGTEGDELDMGRVWQGDLANAWTAVKRQTTVGPSRVLLAVNVGGNSAVDPDSLALRGATALALLSVLREAGYVASLIAVSYGQLFTDSEQYYLSETTLVEPDQDLDIHKIANLVASGLLFRGIIIKHKVLVAEGRCGSGVGQSITTEAPVDTTGYDRVVHVGPMDSPHQASQWLAHTLKSFIQTEEAP